MAVPFDPHAVEREKWRAFPRVRPANIVPPSQSFSNWLAVAIVYLTWPVILAR